jgi:hypothetical protein
MLIPQPDKENAEHGDISEPKVMASAAGYYVGDVFYDEDMDGWIPNSRHTPYMTKEEAENYLEDRSYK